MYTDFGFDFTTHKSLLHFIQHRILTHESRSKLKGLSIYTAIKKVIRLIFMAQFNYISPFSNPFKREERKAWDISVKG